ncbi:efflux RND transporter permease subunit [Actibacterium sp. 188UL27-1]|nr:efflux RND transporter permease subunit [Actibacterium sp. 188UL27-1]MBM7069043.1 efflux RND transporter permease subunit [Actibacterium sp. 188UL27-1]
MQAATDTFEGPRMDWREQELVIAPIYAEERVKAAGVTRDDITESMRFATKGVIGGTYREDDRQIPIYVRAPQDSGTGLVDHLVSSNSGPRLIPIEQVIDGMPLKVQDTLYQRRDRVPTLTLSGSIVPGVSTAEVRAEVFPAIEEIEVPAGYMMAWGGEYEDTLEANRSLANQLPFAIIAIIVISILLFNALCQPLIIWLLVPMAANGAVLGLLFTGLPFSVSALLGLLSLSGILIKDGMVLVEEIDLVHDSGIPLGTCDHSSLNLSSAARHVGYRNDDPGYATPAGRCILYVDGRDDHGRFCIRNGADLDRDVSALQADVPGCREHAPIRTGLELRQRRKHVP